MYGRITRVCGMNALIVAGCLGALALSVVRADALQRGREMKVDAPVEAPDVIAVRVHHDMCPYCKKLAPQFDQLRRQTMDEAVLFVTLDLTSERTQRQAAMMVAALGIESIWTGDLSGIGRVHFIDGTGKKPLATYRAHDAKMPLSAELNNALASTP